MDNSVKRLGQCDFWVLDVDDMMYRIDSGLHALIKGNIVDSFNQLSKKDKNRKDIQARFRVNLEKAGHKLGNPMDIQQAELGVAFPAIVQTVSELLPDKLPMYLDRFYGSRYDLIKPDADLVSAFDIARGKGVEIFFYTNGPSSKDASQDAHVQRVLRAVGFKTPTIDFMRRRTYDLLDSVKAGCGKPTRKSMHDFIEFSNVEPRRAFMADDGPKNLIAAADVGMQTLWTWTTTEAPAPRDVVMAKTIGAIKTQNTGAALLKIAMAR